MNCKFQLCTRQIAFIPTVGIVNSSHYYGYPVYSLAFMWLCFRFCIIFGLKKYKEATP